jgi:GNAT superfamily N-acetyltransferase
MDISEIEKKLNGKLSFKTLPNSEKIKEGFQVDCIEVYLDDKKIGYIKVDYIPKANFDRFYNNIFKYLYKIAGRTWLWPFFDGGSWEDVKNASLFHMLDHLEGWTKACNSGYKDYTKEQVIEVTKRYQKFALQQYGREYRKFKKFHVDNPFVSYVSVDEPYRRFGIGSILYKKMYEYLNAKGMKLYASGLQSDYAKKVWAKFDSQGKTKKDKDRRYYVES